MLRVRASQHYGDQDWWEAMALDPLNHTEGLAVPTELASPLTPKGNDLEGGGGNRVTGSPGAAEPQSDGGDARSALLLSLPSGLNIEGSNDA